MSDEKKSKYVDLRLYNSTNRNIPAVVYNKKQDIIVYNPEEYDLVVVRFTLQTIFPLFYPSFQVISGFNVTNMIIGISYLGVDYFERIIITADEATNGIFNIGPFLDEVNTAAGLAFAALKIAAPGSPAVNAPYFAFDPNTQLINLYLDTGWQDNVVGPNLLFFNQQLQDLLNFPFSSYRPPPNANGNDYTIAVRNSAKALPTAGNRVGYPIALQALGGAMTQVQQEFVQTSNFIDRDKVLFTSNSLPLVSEVTPVNITQSQNNTVSNTFLPIMTDFSLGTGDRSNFIEYLPTAEYRRISMRQGPPIDTVDLQLYYTSTNGSLLPLELPPGGLLDVKLLFEKK